MANELVEIDTLSAKLSKSSLLPAHLRGKEADVFVTVLTGRELGLSPMQSIRSMFVVGGKASMSADMMVALCVSNPRCKYFRLVESTAEVATYETLREGHPEPTRLSFTMRQAEQAGVTRNQTWKAYPEAMLRARASSALARACYPDLLAGVYDSDSDELQQRREQDVTPRPAAVTVEQVMAQPLVASAQLPAAPAPVEAPPLSATVPAPPVQSLREQLAEQIRATATEPAAYAVADAVSAAAKSGRLSAEDRAALVPVFREHLAGLRSKAA